MWLNYFLDELPLWLHCKIHKPDGTSVGAGSPKGPAGILTHEHLKYPGSLLSVNLWESFCFGEFSAVGDFFFK